MAQDKHGRSKKVEKTAAEVAAEKAKAEREAKATKAAKAAALPALQRMRQNLALLERAVESKDKALVSRVLRKNTNLRRTLPTADLRAVLSEYCNSSELLPTLLRGVDCIQEAEAASAAAMETDEAPPLAAAAAAAVVEPVADAEPAADAAEPSPPPTPRSSVLPEVECHLHTFVVSRLLQHKLGDEALRSAQLLVARAAGQNRRTLDVFAARAYAHYARCVEGAGRAREIRVELLGAHRTACLRLNEIGQATLINLILRNFLQHSLVDQAAKFASKASFPDTVSNAQQVRYLYYLGRVQAVQLNYTESFGKLMQAIRKAPSAEGSAVGFRVSLHRLATIVQLLMGETPDRTWFSQPELRAPLRPYFELVNAVRQGDVAEYEACAAKHAAGFGADGNLTLVLRLRQSVIKTGLRRINTSYSKISFADIASKLALENSEVTEFICAKAIRDGVIDADIDHDEGWLCSNDKVDVYSTTEPQEAFHKRIQFCMSVHNDAQKAMRYPPDAHKRSGGGGGEEEKEEEEEETEEEIAKQIEKAFDEEDA